MKITIDTNEDSHEDIRKVIALLSSLTDKNYSRMGKSKNIFEESSPSISSESSEDSAETTQNAFVNLFNSSNDSSSSEEKNEEVEQQAEKEKADGDVEIIPY